jgi:hypothetical protein
MQIDLGLIRAPPAVLHSSVYRYSPIQAKKKGRIAGRGKIYFLMLRGGNLIFQVDSTGAVKAGSFINETQRTGSVVQRRT